MPFPASPAGTKTAITLLFFSLALLGSCATMPERVPENTAGVLWREFIEHRETLRCGIEAIDVKASINLSTPERKTRLIINFRGNLDYPLRLDLTTGFGAPVAYSREDRFGFTAYNPGEETAFISESGQRGALILGLAMPFDLKDLAALASGTFLALLPEAYSNAEQTMDGWTYKFSGNNDVSFATLDFRGRLIVLGGTYEETPWTLTLSGYTEDHPLEPSRPEKLVFEAGEDVKAVIRIKEMRRTAEKWPPKSLELQLPPGTRVRIL